VEIGRAFQTDLHTTVRRLRLLAAQIRKQREHADYYSENLILDRRMLCSEPQGAFFNRLQYPLLLPDAGACEQMKALLRADGISTARPYRDIAAIAAAHYDYQGDCPEAERIARSVLVIPCSHSLSAADVRRVTDAVNRAWRQVGGQRLSQSRVLQRTATSP
jgi:dTDP-4-amino-4,6-dideoxygalactose transaminase